jgi:alkanesulfonate monooxygenase SsuD/methylene tetrahydromethanopterin reductase-like flavin-dependent oxidoreductase (luciferase family)
MRAGINLPQYEIDFAGDTSVVDVACAVEAAGFDSAWVSDHPFAVAPDGSVSGAFEATTLMAHVLASTSRVSVGSLVLASSMRPVEQLVAQARALSLVAPRRVVVGVGAGWYAPEHRAYGVSLSRYPDRVSLLEANVKALKQVGAHAVVGGVSQSVIEVAASVADGWNCAWDVPVDVFKRLSRDLDAACARAGRDPSVVSRSVGVTVLCGSRRECEQAVRRVRARAPFLESLDLRELEKAVVVGSPEECAARIAAYGADEVIITPFERDSIELISRIGREILPALR